jgi:hypothetical protein
MRVVLETVRNRYQHVIGKGGKEVEHAYKSQHILMQKDHEFESSTDYIIRTCLKNKQND